MAEYLPAPTEAELHFEVAGSPFVRQLDQARSQALGDRMAL